MSKPAAHELQTGLGNDRFFRYYREAKKPIRAVVWLSLSNCRLPRPLLYFSLFGLFSLSGPCNFDPLKEHVNAATMVTADLLGR